MHIIIGMPQQPIIIGMPAFIIAIMPSQHCFIISIDMPAIGFISQVMPVSVMVQHISAIIIGIMPPIIGFIIGIMGIMPFIIGFIIGIGIGIMLFIIGIMAGIAVIVVLLRLCRVLLTRPMAEGVSRFPSAGNGVSRGVCTFLRFGGRVAGMAGEFGFVGGNMSAIAEDAGADSVWARAESRLFQRAAQDQRVPE